mmetsp:Transcript_14811/g.30144  ORF Transcript_14811/g.30144 Transcript_14811/m.30144 type:complete len:98 (+) Transcript_14811:116-409(+)
MAFVGGVCGGVVVSSGARAFCGGVVPRKQVSVKTNHSVARMSAVDSVVTDVVVKSADVMNAVLIASKEADFGGYLGPAVSLLAIGALILVLAPPLSD